MYLSDFINKYNGKRIDYDGAYGPQCVDLFRYYCKEVLGLTTQPAGVTGAKDFWGNYSKDSVLKANFTQISNTPSFVPQAGDVAVFYNGTYGHISICTGANSNTKVFESFDQNYPTGSACKKVSHNYTSFYGVLRPKNQSKIKATIIPKYTTGTYKVTASLLHVRTGAGTNYSQKTYSQLTANAQEQNKKLGNAKANGLLKGCVVTVSQVSGNWGKIPSGWICLDYCQKI